MSFHILLEHFFEKIKAREQKIEKGNLFYTFANIKILLTRHFLSDYVIVQLFFLCTGPSLSLAPTPSESPSFYILLTFCFGYFSACTIFFVIQNDVYLARCTRVRGNEFCATRIAKESEKNNKRSCVIFDLWTFDKLYKMLYENLITKTNACVLVKKEQQKVFEYV